MLKASCAGSLTGIVRHQSQLLGIMKHRMSFLFLSLLLVPSLTTMAAAQTTDVNTQLKNVADKIRAKTVAWKMPEAELAPELEELDAICLQHKGENPEDLADVQSPLQELESGPSERAQPRYQSHQVSLLRLISDRLCAKEIPADFCRRRKTSPSLLCAL